MKHLLKSSVRCFGVISFFGGLWLLTCLLFIPLSGVRGQGQSRSVAKPVGTERRIALVIGNINYPPEIGKLNNAVNDADDMAVALKNLGFEVIKITNADYRSMISGINRFKEKLNGDAIAFFFYAGHGTSFNNRNFLLPIDANLECLDRIEEYGISLNRVVADIESKHVKNSLIVLDACRDNLDRKSCDTKRNIPSENRLIPYANNPNGSIVVYATEEGTKAEDRSPNGRNGLFTGALLQYLTIPDLTLKNILDQASLEVLRLSNNQQTPARYDKIYGDFYFLKTQGYTPPVRSTKFLDLPFADMVYVEGGTFEMGSNKGDADAQDDEMVNGKKHSVTVGSFLMGKYEVTQRQWTEIMDNNPSYFKNCDDCPVENVSWNDIQDFLKKLNARTGGNYRLPTEAEWEYAAGGGATNRGTTSRSRFGNGKNTLAPTEANFDASASYKKDYSVVGEYRQKTVKVGSFIPNELGIFDMSGNVWEWCSDWYDTYPSSAQNNPTGPATGTCRVLRGGSWSFTPNFARVASRRSITSEYRGSFNGFRLVSQLQ